MNDYPEIRDYFIVSNSEAPDQIIEVKKMLELGWKPLGPCQYSDMKYVQTLYKD